MAIITVKDASGANVDIQQPLAPGRAAAASSKPVALSNEDSAAIAALATSAKQPALGTAGTPSADVITVQGRTGMTAVKTDGSAVTQPVSAASLPLPTGAATSAKQPALGTAGAASPDVLTVQGVASMTALKVDGSAVTQPVSDGGGVLSVDDGGGSLTVDSGQLPAALDGSGGLKVAIVAGATSGGDASAANQTAVQALPGSDATKAVAVQGVTGGKAVPVSGTFWQSTQPVSAASLPLPTGAATAAKQPALGTAGTASTDVLTVQGIASMTALKVDGSAVTQPVSAAALPLPTGAATSAKQPALGTAGTAASDVITIQGIASMTAVKVDGSAVTQPVSASALPLPTGAATQTTLASIDTNIATLATPDPASGTTDSGSPVKIGSHAVSGQSSLTLVSAGQRSDSFSDLDGSIMVRQVSLADLVTATPVGITDGSSTSVIAAQGAGVKVYITSVTIANSSASAVTVDLRDGAAGAVKWTFPVPAGGGVTHSFGTTPLGFSANTAVAADPSAAASTVTVSLIGFKSKI